MGQLKQARPVQHVTEHPRRKWTLGHKLVGLALLAAIGLSCCLLDPRCRADVAGIAPSIPVVPDFDQTRAWNDLVYQVNAGYRIPGTATHRAVRDWLVSQLAICVKNVQLQAFTEHINGKDVPLWNIIAVMPGTGKGSKELIMLSAHWDSRPICNMDPDPANRNLPLPGANDGASGVAVLLEIARQLKVHPVSRTVKIVLFDGEDYSWPGEDVDHDGVDYMLLGAKYFAQHPGNPKPAWGILLDMIGNPVLDIYREPYSDEHAKAVNDRIFHAAKVLNYRGASHVSGFYDSLYEDQQGNPLTIEDDHTPLNAAGIPTADVIDFNYPVWHTRQDDVAHVSAASLGIVGRTILYAISPQGD